MYAQNLAFVVENKGEFGEQGHTKFREALCQKLIGHEAVLNEIDKNIIAGFSYVLTRTKMI